MSQSSAFSAHGPPAGRAPSNTRRLIGMAALCGCTVWIIQHRPASHFPPANRNRLLIGREARIDGEYPIHLNSPADFDGLAFDEVCRLRREAVAEHASLVADGYRPSYGVFGQVQDGRPWWGIEGQYFHGPGERSIDGASEESRFVLNPFLLAAVDFTGLTPWSPNFNWSYDRIGLEDSISCSRNIGHACFSSFFKKIYQSESRRNIFIFVGHLSPIGFL